MRTNPHSSEIESKRLLRPKLYKAQIAPSVINSMFRTMNEKNKLDTQTRQVPVKKKRQDKSIYTSELMNLKFKKWDVMQYYVP